MNESADSPAQPPVRETEPPPSLQAGPVETYPPPGLVDQINKLFIGPDGLRVGFRLFLYLGMGFAVFWVLRWMAGGLSGLDFLRGLFVDKLIFVLSVTLPALAMARIEQRGFGAYGLPGSKLFGRNFWVGSAWGLGGITLLLVTLYFARAFSFGYPVLHGGRMAKFAIFWAGFFLLVALSEEFLFRGYSLFTLTQGIGFWPAAVVLSIAFGAIHIQNSGEAWIGVVAAGTIGFFFCLTLRRTGDLWFALGFHAAWDWGETYLYSVPDSGMVSPGHLMHSSFHGPAWLTGGPVGPEGSALLFVVMAALWIAFDRLYPDVKHQS